jgi:hypothetical protein
MSVRPTLELRIPISPTPAYQRMVRLLWDSLQHFGGPLARAADIVLSVSAEPDRIGLERAFEFAPPGRIRWRWVDAALFARWEYDATGLDRYLVESKADIIGMFDADLLIAGDFDALLRRSYLEQRLLGCIAHVSPFAAAEHRHLPAAAWWQRLYAEAGLPPPRLDYRHTGWGLMSMDVDQRECPAYFNYGVVLAPRAHTEAIGSSFMAELQTVDRCLETWFKSQIAHTLALERHAVPVGALGMRDNFPLHVPADALRRLNPDPEGKDGDADIRIFHYLGQGEINKGHFESIEQLRSILDRQDLSPSARVFQSRLREILTGWQ